MWQFTRTFIINDNKGKLTNSDNEKVKFFTETTGNILYVDNMVNLNKKQIVSAYKTLGAEGLNDQVSVDLTNAASDLEAGDLIRLVVTLGQEGRVISTYNDAYPEHSKQIFLEAAFPTGGDAEDLASLFIKGFKKVYGNQEGLFATIEADGESTSKICINAADEYTRVKNVRLVKVNVAAPSTNLTGYGDYTVLLEADAKDFGKTTEDIVYCQKGKLGIGTTNYIIQNLQLPSTANTSPFSAANRDERPVPNGVYTQYTIETVTDRRHIGHQVTGALDHSLTTDVFFVLGDPEVEGTAANEFETELKALVGDEFIQLSYSTAEIANTHYHVGFEISASESEVESAPATVDAEAVYENNMLGD